MKKGANFSSGIQVSPRHENTCWKYTRMLRVFARRRKFEYSRIARPNAYTRESQFASSLQELSFALAAGFRVGFCDEWINIDYFMVDECVRFLFTSCERLLRTSERSERVS